MEQKSKTILDILLSTNRLVETEAATFPSDFTNEKIEEKLRKEKLVTSDDITRAYGILFDLPVIHLQNLNIKPEVLNLIPKNVADKYKVIVFEKEGQIPGPKGAPLGGGKIKMAFAKPANLKSNPPQIIADLKNQKGVTVDIYLTSLEDLEAVLDRYEQKNQVQAVISHLNQKPQMAVTGLKTVDLKNYKISYDVISKFPIEISQKYNIVVFGTSTALGVNSSAIKVAVSDPDDPKVKEILDFVKEKNEIAIEEFVASPQEINEAIKLYYRRPSTIVPVNPVSSVVASPQQHASPVGGPTVEPVVRPKPVASPQQQFTSPTGGPTVSSPPPAAPTPLPNPAIAHPAQPMYSPKPHFTPKPVVQAPNPNTTATTGAYPTNTSEEQIQGRVIAPESDLDKFLGQEVKNIEALKQIAQTGNVPKILAATVALAVEKKASDIHIEPEDKDLRIRFRVDGVLRDVIKMPVEIQPAIISRVKILSRLKIDEQRVPQDGRFDVTTQGHEIDLRVSTLPTVRGEKAALRILDKTQNIYTLEQLGFLGRNLKVLEENITKPFGVILATGPTGSGKSTTLYSILQKISTPSVNVITLEDPVEYEIPGINQCQVKPKIGFSFADGLRSVLRQDPNIIMVGEIRDSETASMATHAALTGHLVLSTLHTNDAAGALPRLINMGIEPFLITSSVNVIIAQRLVRKICQKCKKEAVIPEAFKAEIEKELAPLHLPQPYKFYEGQGCPECDHGYSGRMGIYEVLDMSDKIEDLAIKKRPASEIAQAAIEGGMITLKQDGLLKASKGETSVSEVLRVTTNG